MPEVSYTAVLDLLKNNKHLDYYEDSGPGVLFGKGIGLVLRSFDGVPVCYLVLKQGDDQGHAGLLAKKFGDNRLSGDVFGFLSKEGAEFGFDVVNLLKCSLFVSFSVDGEMKNEYQVVAHLQRLKQTSNHVAYIALDVA